MFLRLDPFAKGVNARLGTLFLVLIRTLHPHERLQVDHIPRAKVAIVAADLVGEIEEALIGREVWTRLIMELKTVFARRDPGHIWLEEDVRLWLCDESKDSQQRP